MQKVYLIGLTGKKGHGKTTAKEFITKKAEAQGFKVISVSFKDGLIRQMRQQMPRTLAYLSEHYAMTVDQLFALKPPMMRTLMQEYGTDIYRSIDPDYWVNEWSITIVGHLQSNTKDNLVIITDDVRFKNEYERFIAQGGQVYRIIRTGYDDNVSTTHISETELDGVDIKSFTASNPEELYQELKSLNFRG